MGNLIVAVVIAIFAMIVISKIARVVPQQQAWVVERLGKYSTTLHAGFHILVPFLDTVRYKHSLKELALDVPEQVCITKDNVQVGVDGVLYLQVLDARSASYGITNYRFAITQLAQTTLRSVLGQSLRNFELIVVDDGSSDLTPDILDRFTDARMRVLTQPNRAPASHNSSRATGEASAVSTRRTGRKRSRNACVAGRMPPSP